MRNTTSKKGNDKNKFTKSSVLLFKFSGSIIKIYKTNIHIKIYKSKLITLTLLNCILKFTFQTQVKSYKKNNTKYNAAEARIPDKMNNLLTSK